MMSLVRNGYILKLHFQIKTQENCPLLESIYNVKFMSLCFIDKNINHKLLILNCFQNIFYDYKLCIFIENL